MNNASRIGDKPERRLKEHIEFVESLPYKGKACRGKTKDAEKTKAQTRGT